MYLLLSSYSVLPCCCSFVTFSRFRFHFYSFLRIAPFNFLLIYIDKNNTHLMDDDFLFPFIHHSADFCSFFFTSSSCSNQYALIRCFCFFWCSSSKYSCRRVCVGWCANMCVCSCGWFQLLFLRTWSFQLPDPDVAKRRKIREVTRHGVVKSRNSSIPNVLRYSLSLSKVRFRHFGFAFVPLSRSWRSCCSRRFCWGVLVCMTCRFLSVFCCWVCLCVCCSIFLPFSLLFSYV